LSSLLSPDSSPQTSPEFKFYTVPHGMAATVCK